MIEFKRPQDLVISVVDNEIIRRYMARIQNGETLDPVIVNGSKIKDGAHRSAAYRKLGMLIPTVTQ